MSERIFLNVIGLLKKDGLKGEKGIILSWLKKG